LDLGSGLAGGIGARGQLEIQLPATAIWISVSEGIPDCVIDLYDVLQGIRDV
jgi:hypothetical protein